MTVAGPFIRRPVATTLLMVALLLGGVLGFRALPVAALPTVEFPAIQVTAAQPGASAEVMASSVTTPLELRLGGLPGLVSMNSVSNFGSSTINLQFSLRRGLDQAAQDVQSALSGASTILPAALVNPPTYARVNPADQPILTLALTSDTLPLSRVDEAVQARLIQGLSQVDGVGLVAVQGGQARAVRLQLDPAALAAHGLSLEDVRAAVARTSLLAPKGNLEGPTQSFAIGADDQLLLPDAYAGIVLATHDGAPLRLRDVGHVVDGVENTRLGAWSGRIPAILVTISRQPGANIIATVDRLQAVLPQLRAALPAGIALEILSDRTRVIRATIADMALSVAVAIGLVVLVIGVSLRRFWLTLIPVLSLPLSIAGTLVVLAIAGGSLDMLSLMALTLSSGFVVDDAIVMIENIVRHLEAGESPLDAALNGARQIAFTVVSLTLSLTAVFLPLLLMSGVVGRLFREFAVTVTAGVLVSAAVALTVIPALCAQLLRGAGPRRGGGGALRLAYERSLQVSLRHPLATTAVLLVATAVSVQLFITLPKGFLPEQDGGLVVGVTEAAQDISYAAMAARQRALVDVLLRDADVASVASFIGGDRDGATGNVGRLAVALRPRPARRQRTDAVMQRLLAAAAAIPAISLHLQPLQEIQLDNRIARTQYDFTLQDADPAALTHWGPRLLAALRRRPELRDVASDQQSAGRQIMVSVSRTRAQQLGVSMAAIDETLYDAFGQRQVATLYGLSLQSHVVLEVDPKYQQDPAGLAALHVRADDGSQVRLDALATFEIGTAPLAIGHLDRFPSVTIFFDVAGGYALGQAIAAIEATRREIGLPTDIVARFSGSAGAFRESLLDQPALILSAIIVVYIVLGILYESFLHPLTILSTLPSAGAGALAALRCGGYALDVMSLIAVVLLIGIAKKNAILMIDFALSAQRRGTPPQAAILLACRLRFRPIMMTTMAALLGALPLLFGQGPEAALLRPVGVAIIGGLLVSQLLTLYTTPAVYLMFARLAAALQTPRVAAAE